MGALQLIYMQFLCILRSSFYYYYLFICSRLEEKALFHSLNSYVVPNPNLFMLCSLNYLQNVYKTSRGKPAKHLRLF